MAQVRHTERRLKILHLFSSWKWTGPAEPVSLLVRELRASGLDVDFLLPPPPDPEFESLERELSGRSELHTLFPGLDRKQLQRLPVGLWKLVRLIRQKRPDIVHVHHSHDHLLAAAAIRLSRPKLRLVRSDFHRDGLPAAERRLPLSWLADAVVTFSRMSQEVWRENTRIEPARIVRVPPVFDVNKGCAEDRSEVRQSLGLTDDDFLVGLACRLQADRHIEVFFDAIARLADQLPRLTGLVLGRSSQEGESIGRPLRERALNRRVIRAGYRGKDYPAWLSAMDAFVFTRAGSDGTGRGLLEAMGQGVPVVLNQTGMLPEFVEPGVSGLFYDGSAPDLARQVRILEASPKLRQELAGAARKAARDSFQAGRQAAEIKALYKEIIAPE